jgi:hypothetical protein
LFEIFPHFYIKSLVWRRGDILAGQSGLSRSSLMRRLRRFVVHSIARYITLVLALLGLSFNFSTATASAAEPVADEEQISSLDAAKLDLIKRLTVSLEFQRRLILGENSPHSRDGLCQAAIRKVTPNELGMLLALYETEGATESDFLLGKSLMGFVWALLDAEEWGPISQRAAARAYESVYTSLGNTLGKGFLESPEELYDRWFNGLQPMARELKDAELFKTMYYLAFRLDKDKAVVDNWGRLHVEALFYDLFGDGVVQHPHEDILVMNKAMEWAEEIGLDDQILYVQLSFYDYYLDLFLRGTQQCQDCLGHSKDVHLPGHIVFHYNPYAERCWQKKCQLLTVDAYVRFLDYASEMGVSREVARMDTVEFMTESKWAEVYDYYGIDGVDELSWALGDEHTPQYCTGY